MSNFWQGTTILLAIIFVIVRVRTDCTPIFWIARGLIYVEAAWGQLESIAVAAVKQAKAEYGGMVGVVSRKVVSG